MFIISTTTIFYVTVKVLITCVLMRELGSGFTLRSLLNASTSDFAKILGIDEHVAKLVSGAINKAIKKSRSIP